ncbi:LysR family transcriptional regulator [Aliiroseovarius sp.]|uniref:LysR family transcriptional regulator n=1 Tax=Aliiroseovarius sp. TaxID=1872442 RepID=UPI002607E408|nr:LysR family transcriptional regulator [Aliiroseovarius sp.]
MQNAGFDQLPLEWIRAFETAARLGSFTAAATETGLTQSAISQRIAHLENRLGARLFAREARRISLTAEGEAWLPHVQAALAGLRDSSEALFGVAKNRMTLSASASIIELWLVPRLARLTAEIGVQVKLRTMVVSSDEAKDDTAIRVRYGSGDWPVAYKRPLYDEAFGLVATPELLTQGPLATLPRLAVAGPRPGWGPWCEQTGMPTTPLPELRFDTFSLGLAAARAGLGVLIASLPLVGEDLARGTLVRASRHVLPHHETYWLLGARERMSRRQWERLGDCLTGPAGISRTG